MLSAALVWIAGPQAHASASAVGCDVAQLIEAIDAANRTAGANTLELAAGCTYTLTAVNNDVGAGPNGLPLVQSQISIHGNGASITRSSSEDTPPFRLLQVTEGAQLSLRDVALSGGRLGVDSSLLGAAADGAGIFNGGSLTLTNTALSANAAPNGRGGGVHNSGELTAVNSTFLGNSAAFGGGIYNIDSLTVIGSAFRKNTAARGGGMENAAEFTVSDSTFAQNTADSGGGISNASSIATATVAGSTFSANSARRGGGIDNSGFADVGTLAVVNSTFTGNSGDTTGGAIANNIALVVTHSTVSGNRAAAGAGIGNAGPEATSNLRNTLLADNPGGNCLLVSDGGHNLSWPASDATCPATFAAGDPKLAPLGDNGGPTMTMALGSGSAAVDAVPAEGAACVATDQRGVIRPQDGDANGTADCDTGAFEVEAADLAIGLAAAPNPVKGGDRVTYTITVRNLSLSGATAVSVTNAFPAESAFSGVSAPGWTCQVPPIGGTGTMTCTRPNLGPGGDAVIEAVVRVFAPKRTTVFDRATVSAATPDPNPANNSASASVFVK